MSDIVKKIVPGLTIEPIVREKTDLEAIREEIIGQEVAEQIQEAKKPESILSEIRDKLRRRKRIKITKEHRDLGIDDKIQQAAIRAEMEYKFERFLTRAFEDRNPDTLY